MVEGFYLDTAIWNIKIPQKEEILTHAQIQDFNIPKNSYVIEKDFVLYKLIDLNNIALLTKDPNISVFFLYIINLKSGKILQSFSIANVDSRFPT